MAVTTALYVILTTRGFRDGIDPNIAGHIMADTFENIRPNEPTMIVYEPECKKSRYEDDGRTLIKPTKATQKVYAKLDDYHSPETLSESIGRKVTTQYVVTFLLAEEY